MLYYGAPGSSFETGTCSPSNCSLQEGWASWAHADLHAAPLNTLLPAAHCHATHAGASAVL
jgi:hypothetical protein